MKFSFKCKNDPDTMVAPLTPKQCVKQSSRGSCPPVSGGVIWRDTVQRPPEALRRGRNFFLGYFVSISFPIEFDVSVRLCTHFEAAKVMTFAPVTQHFSVSTAVLSHTTRTKGKKPKQEGS